MLETTFFSVNYVKKFICTTWLGFRMCSPIGSGHKVCDPLKIWFKQALLHGLVNVSFLIISLQFSGMIAFVVSSPWFTALPQWLSIMIFIFKSFALLGIHTLLSTFQRSSSPVITFCGRPSACFNWFASSFIGSPNFSALFMVPLNIESKLSHYDFIYPHSLNLRFNRPFNLFLLPSMCLISNLKSGWNNFQWWSLDGMYPAKL